MKVFAAIFPLFCLYFLHSSQARAEAPGSDGVSVCHQRTDQHFENASPCARPEFPNIDSGKCLFYLCLVPEQKKIIFPQAQFVEFLKFIHRLYARDFHIHTGLSPPLLIA